jgi:hypothetical protein
MYSSRILSIKTLKSFLLAFALILSVIANHFFQTSIRIQKGNVDNNSNRYVLDICFPLKHLDSGLIGKLQNKLKANWISTTKRRA